MARRIELPSADVLFGDKPGGADAASRKAAAGAAPGSRVSESAAAKKGSKSRAPKTAAAKQDARARTPKTSAVKQGSKSRKPKTAAAKHGPQPRTTTTTPRAPQRRRPTPEARLAAIESRLPELPVDALIDLRDNLEDLLAADTLDEAAVRRLLDSVGA